MLEADPPRFILKGNQVEIRIGIEQQVNYNKFCRIFQNNHENVLEPS